MMDLNEIFISFSLIFINYYGIILLVKRKEYIMGWMFEYSTGSMKVREYANEIIDRFTKDDDLMKLSVLDHSLVGNHLWVVFSRIAKENNKEIKFICLFLLAKSDGCWGYKDIDEYCGPAYYDCPKRLLGLCEVDKESDPNGYATNWRKSVLNYHENQAHKRKRKRLVKKRDQYQANINRLRWIKDESEYIKLEKETIRLRDYLTENGVIIQ
jgi:hypothetical protein